MSKPDRGKTSRITLEEWNEIIVVYGDMNGNTSLTLTELKRRGMKITMNTLVKYLNHGDDSRNLPPIHDMWREAISRAVQKIRVDMSEKMMETLKLTDAYKHVLAKKIVELDQNPDKVTRNIGGELRSIFNVEVGIMGAISGHNDGDDIDSMPLQMAKKKADEARAAIARIKPAQVEDSDDYGLSDVIKVEGGEKVAYLHGKK